MPIYLAVTGKYWEDEIEALDISKAHKPEDLLGCKLIPREIGSDEHRIFLA